MAKKIQIEGIAIVEGKSRNNVMYKAEALHKFAPTLEGRPILKDHTNSSDAVIGKVTKTESIDGGKMVRYKGWVKEDGTGIVDKIQDGRISEVSIGAIAGKLLKESEDADYVIAEDLNALELSTTPVPGVQGTSLTSKENVELSESVIKKIIEEYDSKAEEEGETKPDDESKETKVICPKCGALMEPVKEVMMECPKCGYTKNMKESYSSSKEEKLETNIRRLNMESNNEKIEVAKIDESIELKAKLAESTKIIAEMKEAQRQDAIASYNEKAKSKGVTALDVTNMTMESIKALTLQLESFKVAEAKVETKVEEKKEVAQPKSVEARESVQSNTAFDGYVIEHSELGGLSFYRAK